MVKDSFTAAVLERPQIRVDGVVIVRARPVPGIEHGRVVREIEVEEVRVREIQVTVNKAADLRKGERPPEPEGRRLNRTETLPTIKVAAYEIGVAGRGFLASRLAGKDL